MLTPKDLHSEQVEAYKDIIRRKVFCICDDCGFGKSIIGLSAMVVMLRKQPQSKMLVVCTPKGVKGTWKTEHTNWTHTKHLRVATLSGTPAQRLKLLKENNHDVYAISYNSLEWLADNNDDINFTFVYADEADCLKGPTSVWRGSLLDAAPKAKYRILASATPKAKEEDDYWGLCKYLDDGKALGTSTVTEFRSSYCTSYNFNNRTIYKIKPSEIPRLEKNIEHLFRRYANGDENQVPIKIVNAYGELCDSSREKYDQLLKEQCLNSIIFDDEGLKDHKKSLDAMTLSGKLNQLTSGFLYKDENLRITPQMLMRTTNVKKLVEDSRKKVAIDVFDDRINAFGKLIKAIKKQHGDDIPIAIPYVFKHELEQLKRLLPTGVSDAEENIEDRFNNNEIAYLFMQYSRSSKSLNLQKGKGYVMAMYSATFKWVDDYQIIRRLARQGQKADMVWVYRLHMRNTIDDVKTKKLNERFAGHTRFQNRLLNSF